MKDRLSWIPLSHRKNVTLPSVTYEEYTGQEYGGYYTPGSCNLVVVLHPEDNTPAIIAHEFRHHIQYELNLYTRMSSVLDMSLTYEKLINSYFNKYPHEMDALLFEHKYAKSSINDWWLKHLVTPNGNK